MKVLILFIVGVLVCAQMALAGDKVKTEILTQDSLTWDGSGFNYPVGKSEISIVRITVPNGVEISEHCHPVPLAAYVVRGAITVTTSSGEKKTFQQGKAFVEVMNTWHKGLGIGEETELIVFYAGQERLPLSVKRNGDSVLANRCH
jgi:quercetin dioxygenase-like cupin family protein